MFFQQQVWQLISQIGESQRLTYRVQTINVLIGIVHLIAIIIFLQIGWLSVESVFYLVTIEFLIVTIVFRKVFPISYSQEQTSPGKVFEQFKRYCLPLVPYAWLSMLVVFADTWLLQFFGGAVEQAYYAVAAQFAAISLIATTSVLKIFWKEVAEAHAQNNLSRVEQLYLRMNRSLYILGSIISGFLIPWAPEILSAVLGEDYVSGNVVFAMMLLYPIHQALGQVNGTLFYALELTRPYVVIGAVSMILSTIVIFFLLAPTDFHIPGLGLASMGLALKMIILQIVTVNFSIWWLSRKQGWQFDWLYQIVGVLLFLLIGYVCYSFGRDFLDEFSFITRFLLCAPIYLFLSGLVLYLVPSLLGISREHMMKVISQNFVALLKLRTW